MMSRKTGAHFVWDLFWSFAHLFPTNRKIIAESKRDQPTRPTEHIDRRLFTFEATEQNTGKNRYWPIMVVREEEENWRNGDESNNQRRTKNKSKGVDPATFYQCSPSKERRRRRKTFEKKIAPILNYAYEQVGTNNRREWYDENIKSKRAAFRDVTALKTFPLQDAAVQKWNKMMEVHGVKVSISEDESRGVINDEDAEDAGGATTSDSVDEETKRRKNGVGKDTSACTKKKRFVEDFLQDQTNVVEERSDGEKKSQNFQPALWSMVSEHLCFLRVSLNKRDYQQRSDVHKNYFTVDSFPGTPNLFFGNFDHRKAQVHRRKLWKVCGHVLEEDVSYRKALLRTHPRRHTLQALFR